MNKHRIRIIYDIKAINNNKKKPYAWFFSMETLLNYLKFSPWAYKILIK